MLWRMTPHLATATLTAATPAFAATDPGFGPRHMAISGDKKFIYVLSEMKSSGFLNFIPGVRKLAWVVIPALVEAMFEREPKNSLKL